MEDLKAMARARRASSKRGRARHSHHKHAHTAAASGDPAAATAVAAAREQSALESGLPSNWERYSDGGGSEDEGAASLLDGEIRPKSKGADYLQLLSSDEPKLYEDIPEPEGMFSLMLESGLGLWDGDSWLEAPSASEQQTAHDAVALLSLDLGRLGRSLARLHVAERLMVEKDLFPEQETVKEEVGTSDHPARSPVFRTESRPQVDVQYNLVEAYSGADIRNHEITASPPRANGEVDWIARVASDAVRSPRSTSPVKLLGSISGSNGDRLGVRPNILEQASRPDLRTTLDTPAQPPGYRKFVPSAAEADLDELLDMLDSHVSQPTLTSSSRRNGKELASTPYLSFLSNSSAGSTQSPGIDSLPRESSRTPAVGSGSHDMTAIAADKDRSERSKTSSKQDISISALSLDDDFDSWIDSI